MDATCTTLVKWIHVPVYVIVTPYRAFQDHQFYSIILQPLLFHWQLKWAFASIWMTEIFQLLIVLYMWSPKLHIKYISFLIPPSLISSDMLSHLKMVQTCIWVYLTTQNSICINVFSINILTGTLCYLG